jgi:hypothetical protein
MRRSITVAIIPIKIVINNALLRYLAAINVGGDTNCWLSPLMSEAPKKFARILSLACNNIEFFFGFYQEIFPAKKFLSTYFCVMFVDNPLFFRR